jgi:hypothetical protein
VVKRPVYETLGTVVPLPKGPGEQGQGTQHCRPQQPRPAGRVGHALTQRLGICFCALQQLSSQSASTSSAASQLSSFPM